MSNGSPPNYNTAPMPANNMPANSIGGQRNEK